MDDGIIYQLEDAQQFWAELDDILTRGDGSAEVARGCIDLYIGLVASHQDDFLDTTTSDDLASCCYKLLDSSLFSKYNSKIMEGIIDRAARRDDLNDLYVTYHILLLSGKENPNIFKLVLARRKREIFAKLKRQICELEGMIDAPFINYLVDLVEKTRDDTDETFNYSILKLILAFNEQFMRSPLPNSANSTSSATAVKLGNVVLQVLGTRIGTSKTFGENLIFMLNRCVEPSIQMIILKLLYELFNTPQTYEFFYTNDLRVLLDVFIRELYNLPDERENLRNVYLRVLCPLLHNTQLYQLRYKQHQIYSLLMDLVGANTQNLKTVPITTQELVRDCLLGGYLDGFIQNGNVSGENVNGRANGTNGHTGNIPASSHGNDGTNGANNAVIGKNATDGANNAENKAEGAVVAGA
ncbi:7654_t:CDS:2 [Paraglomus brasilianum]|uniref:7654_t:CDS:1 n=1 Tax=Paraglomus brasilianum TaxID=144538 RepID=A0A9N9DBE8_9GLOM|nr:7654_t:CDS:2 [Paraglomus brasilianum]